MRISPCRRPAPMPSSMQFLCAWAIALAAPLFAGGAEVAAPQELEPVRQVIREGLERGRAPSVALAVVRDGQVVWAEGFGMADVEKQRPATAESIYILASVSKPITATGLMVLEERGRVDLRRPANDYLPGAKLRAYRGSAEEITLERLANHTGGLPVHWHFFYAGAAPPSREETIRRYGFAFQPPGSGWEYSNLAFGVLDYVIEVVSGKPWGEFMESEVYDPLGMASTSHRVRPGREAQATVQYHPDLAGWFLPVTPYRFDHDGASAVWSSALDLARFLRMHLAGGVLDGRRFLREETVVRMRTLTAAQRPERPERGVGIAWFVEPYRGRPSFSHGGGMPGVATTLRGFPEDRSGWVVLINSSAGGFLGEIEKKLGETLFPVAPPEAEDRGRRRERGPGADPQAFLGLWKGRLVHHRGDLPLELDVKAEKARIRFGGGEWGELRDSGLRGGKLRGTVEGRLEAQESHHGPVTLELALERDGPRLVGVGRANAADCFGLPYWVELERAGGPEDPAAGGGLAGAAATLVPGRSRRAERYDLLIRGGRIFDGTGAPSFRADLAVKEGRIARVGRLEEAAAERTLDAAGLAVAPGFVDLMGQTASPFLEDPRAAMNLLTQGITTILAGEGDSAAPLTEEEARRRGWRSMREYLDLLEKKGLPLNVAQTVGHTQVRKVVMGEGDRAPSSEELERMKALVREAMEAGAVGLSTALIYPPAVYASREEIAALCQVAGAAGGRYYTHMRNEGDRLLEAIEEALEIARAGQASLHIFHLKAAGRANWPKMEKALERLAAARAAGQEVDADIYPYINNGLGLESFVHPRHFAGGRQGFLERIRETAGRAEVRKEIEEGQGWENWYRHVGGDWDRVVLGRVGAQAYRAHQGKSLAQAARAERKDPWELFFELLPEGAFVLPETMTEENLLLALRADSISFCTDVGPAAGSTIAGHPRSHGAFPRLLSRYVRERGALPLERAVARLSALGANHVLARDRGRIAEGLAADLVVFDPDRIADRATFAAPSELSVGVRHVVVNGRLVLEDGSYSEGALPGKVLRGPGYRDPR